MEESPDQRIRDLERKSRQAPTKVALKEALAAAYLRQNRISAAIDTLQSGALFKPQNLVAREVASEIKKRQWPTLKRLFRETRVWSWPTLSNPSLIPIRELDHESPVIFGLLFRERDFSVLQAASDVPLWLQSLSINRADHYAQDLTSWTLSLPHLWQLHIHFTQLNPKRAKQILSLSKIQDLTLACDGSCPQLFFSGLPRLNTLKRLQYFGSLLNLSALNLSDMPAMTQLHLTIRRPISESFQFRFPPNLNELTLQVSTLSPESLKSLAKLQSLDTLRVGSIRSSTGLIEVLLQLPKLRSLSLYPRLFSEEELTRIKEHCPQLTKIHVESDPPLQ